MVHRLALPDSQFNKQEGALPPQLVYRGNVILRFSRQGWVPSMRPNAINKP
jgi:hypothetical protein